MPVADTADPTTTRRVGNHNAPDLVRSRELSTSTILVAASGDVDAVTATGLSESIEQHLTGYRQLVLDLSRVEFFGTAGYSVLHRVHSRCCRSGIDWVLVAGPEVERLLRVCDPDGMQPTAPNIVSAVATLARGHTARVG